MDIKKSSQREFILTFNLHNLTFDYASLLPALFYEKDYGMLNRFTSLRRGNQLVLAPNFSDEIMIYDLEKNKWTYPVVKKTDKYSHVAQPFLLKSGYKISNWKEEELNRRMMEHYQRNDEFVNILYDPYRKQYYRTLFEKDKTTGKQKALTIVVLDEKFSFLKSKPLGNKYAYTGMFVTDKGLNILNLEKYRNNDNLLSFDTFKL